MAYLETLNPDEEEAKRDETSPGASFTPSSAAGSEVGSPSASAPPASGSAAAPIASYFSVNREAAQSMGEKVGDSVENAGRDAVESWDQGKAVQAQARAQSLGSQEALASELDQTYKDPGYTSGMAALDAYAAQRGSDPGRFQAIKDKFAGLDWNVVGSAGPGAVPTAPDYGQAPAAPKEPTYEDTTYMDPQSKQAATERNNAKRAAYEAEQRKYEAALADYDRQYQETQSQYNQDAAAYKQANAAWEASRRPLLEAFGLLPRGKYDPQQPPTADDPRWRPRSVGGAA